jgi:uncharacterized membrane protein YedE/YeeE
MELFALRCPWYVAGPMLGLLVVGLLWTINKPLGALGGYIDTYNWIRKPGSNPSWRVFFFIGIVLGGVLSVVLAGHGFHPTLAYGAFDSTLGTTPGAKAVILFAAGTLIGYGARWAAGCTSGHGMCGTALGSPASFVATITFMGSAIVTAHLLSFLVGGGS